MTLCDSVGAELQFGEACVQIIFTYQLIMRACCHDAAMVHHHQAVCFFYCGQPVGDNQCSATLHQALKRFLDQALTLSVKRTGCLIE